MGLVSPSFSAGLAVDLQCKESRIGLVVRRYLQLVRFGSVCVCGSTLIH